MNVEKVAEEWFDRDDDDYAALVVGFTEGWEAALPEVPDDAVIEAMARALDESDPEGGNAHPVPGSQPWEWWMPQARAAYAALRGAMQ